MLLLSLLAFLVSLVAAGAIVRWSPGRLGECGPHDPPQRFHEGNVPRIGGIALLAGIALAWLVAWVETAFFNDPARLRLDGQGFTWLVIVLPAVLGGIAEDLTQRLSVRFRLALTATAGLLAVAWFGFSVPRVGLPGLDLLLQMAPWLGAAIALVAVAGLPHAFNIIDGYNGLAAMVAIVVCLALAHVALQVDDRALAMLMVTTAAATLGFLVWNYPYGMVFAGDGGAYLWGIVVALASLSLVQRHAEVSPWFPVLLLIYPVWETLFSMYRKLRHGVSPGVADALHFHQLIYRRIVSRVFDDDAARAMLMRNSRTSPYLWGLTLLTAVPAVLFWNRTWVLIGFCAVFVVGYVLAYLALIRFKVPRVLRRRR
ncbi:MAG: glycosyltransferase [Ottowia sp.]|nr:glycosyltransferase [Ottowia sp.]